MTKFTESTLEKATLDWLESLGYGYVFGHDIAFTGFAPECAPHHDVVLECNSTMFLRVCAIPCCGW